MNTDLTKEEEKGQKENLKELIKKKNSYKNCEDLNDELENLSSKTKGLSIAIDNRVLEHYTKPLEEYGKAFNMKHLGRLFTLMILNRKHKLNKHVSFEYIANMFKLNTNVSYNRLKSDVRKVLRELYPTIEYKEDPIKGIKFTHMPKGANEGNHIEKNETRGFTQLYCDLIYFGNSDIIVLFTILEYFKGSSKEVKPSIATICKLSGCKDRNKINNLLKEFQVTEEKNGLWKIISSKGGSKQNTNRYELSYVTEEGLERYYYLDFLEAKFNKQEEELIEEAW